MFKRLLIPSLILAVAVPLTAQRVRNPQKQARVQQVLPKGRRGMVRGLKALNPTPDQISQWKAIREGNKAQREAIMQEMRQKRQALQELRSQTNPDPTQLGNAMLALRDTQKSVQQFQEQSMESFKRTLTPDQLKKLEELQSRRKNRRGGI